MTFFNNDEMWRNAIIERIKHEAYGPVMRQRTLLRQDGRQGRHVVLPKHLDPGKYEGVDASDRPATLFGMDVTFWGKDVLVVD